PWFRTRWGKRSPFPRSCAMKRKASRAACRGATPTCSTGSSSNINTGCSVTSSTSRAIGPTPKIFSRRRGCVCSSAAINTTANRRDGRGFEHSGLDCEVAAVSRTRCAARRTAGRRGMSENVHDRALQLVAKGRVEGLEDSERDWLTAHLQDCGFCNEHARRTDRALRLLRTAAIPVPADLASRTQFRVRLRAMEMRDREPKRRLLWLACAASWIFGIA